MAAHTLLVICDPAAPYLRQLERIPSETRIVVGKELDLLRATAPDADVVVFTGPLRGLLREIWPDLKKVQWVHSLFAGLDNVLFPELIESPVTMTNARGVFARTLGEYAIAGILWFAKDLNRMRRQQAAHVWEQFNVQEVYGKVLGIVGYGGIGRAAAERAKAFGIKIHALRRRPEKSQDDPLVDRGYGPDQLHELIAASDYLLVAAPLTRETEGLMGPAEFAQMKSDAVFINLGRGPLVQEPALIDVLKKGAIRGAVLDVFNEEPLPADNPFYDLDNVLLSPHCADNTDTWLFETMDFFVDNFIRFHQGQPLENIVDKHAGY